MILTDSSEDNSTTDVQLRRLGINSSVVDASKKLKKALILQESSFEVTLLGDQGDVARKPKHVHEQF